MDEGGSSILTLPTDILHRLSCSSFLLVTLSNGHVCYITYLVLVSVEDLADTQRLVERRKKRGT